MEKSLYLTEILKGEKIMPRLGILIVLLMAASMMLVACQSALPPASAPPVATESHVALEEPTPEDEMPVAVDFSCSPNCQYSDLVVGFVQTGSEGGWRAANTTSFKETAARLGVTLKFYDSKNDPERQVDGFEQFIMDPEVNVIILAAIETTGWEEVLQEAKDAGKIVVIEDRRIDAPETLYATYIGSDFVLE
jgi:ABC-type sugar transport system substrate-binding protein